MAIREALLALLEQSPSTAYQLKQGFERATSRIWPLNMGQISTTLQRLHRDGLIEEEPKRHDEAVVWKLTDDGRREAEQWWLTPVTLEQRGRDELVMKLAFAAVTPGVDLNQLIERQRICLQRLLHDVTRAKRLTDADNIAARLVLDHHIFATEAGWIRSTKPCCAMPRAATRPVSKMPMTSRRHRPVSLCLTCMFTRAESRSWK